MCLSIVNINLKFRSSLLSGYTNSTCLYCSLKPIDKVIWEPLWIFQTTCSPDSIWSEKNENAPEPPSFVKPSMPSWTETPKHRTSTNPWVYGKTRSATDSHIKKTFARNGRHNLSRFRHLHSDWFSTRHRAGRARAASLWTPDQALLPMKVVVLP